MDATTEAPALLEKKTHDAARYGERWAHRLDARHDQVRWRQLRALYGFRNPQTPGAVQARASYEKVLALYEAERAQALAESMSSGLTATERDVYELA